MLRSPLPRAWSRPGRRAATPRAAGPTVLVEGVQGHGAQLSHVLVHVTCPEDLRQFPPRGPLRECGFLFQGD